MCGPGERILSHGDPARRVFALERGSVRVFHSAPSGAELLLVIFGAPALFGHAEAFAGIAHLENVEAIEPCELVVIPAAALLDFFRQDAGAATAMVIDQAVNLTFTIQRQKSLAFDAVTTRLANFLFDYALWTQRTGNDLLVRLSQEQLAHAVGATRRSVAHDFALWTREGIIERRGRHYIIRDLEGLRRYCDVEHLALTYRVGGRIDGLNQRRPAARSRRR
jgi:CRP-like cAMP-binding protein